MRRGFPVRHAWVACAAVLAVASMLGVVRPRAVHADEAIVYLVLSDGTKLQGALVEQVPNDHVTLRLATGEIRVVPWSSIQSVTDTTPTPWTPGPGYATGVGVLGSKDDVHWPEPDRSPSPYRGSHLYLGFANGIGTPTGYAGVVAALDPVPWLELEGGVGLGGTFGPGFAGIARGMVPLRKNFRIGFGLGLSENVLSASNRAVDGDYPRAPQISRWLNLEFVHLDVTSRVGTTFRFFTGFAFLLNRGDYENVCPPGSADQGSPSFDARCKSTGFPESPRSFSGDHRAPFVPYFGIALMWRLL